jgi:hypothetical protein
MPEDEIIEEPPAEPAEVVEDAFALPEDFADQVKGWDIPLDELPQAVAFHKALQSEDGVIDTFIRTGQSLGFGLKELEGLLGPETPAEPAAPAAPVPDPIIGDDPDRLLSAAEVAQIMERERAQFEERFTKADEERQAKEFAAVQKATFDRIDQFFDSKEISDPETRRFVAQLGEKTIPAGANSYDPAVVQAALERGLAAYEDFVEKQAAAYIARKAGTAQGQPTPVGGGSAPGGEGDDEVDYAKLGNKALDTARERVRARLRENGEL